MRNTSIFKQVLEILNTFITSIFKQILEILNTFITPREQHCAPLLALLVRTYSALSITNDALPTLPASVASAVVSAAAFVACCLCCCLCPSVLLVPDSATD